MQTGIVIKSVKGLSEGDPRAAVSCWLESLDVSPRTRDAYTRNIGYYVAWLDAQGRDGLRAGDVMDYKRTLQAGRSPSTVAAYLSPVRSFYGWLAATQGVPDISAGVHPGRRSKGFRRDPLSVEDVRAVLGRIGDARPEDLRDRALVGLLVHTGLRLAEVQRADVSDVRTLMGRTVLYIQGKGRNEKDAYVVLGAAVLSPLREYLASRGQPSGGAPLFCSHSDRNAGDRLTTRSLSRIVKGRMRDAGIDSERVTAHSLRHTAVTLALIGGATVQEVQAMARHASIQTTMIYAHNVDRAANPAEDAVSRMLD